ncbi:hypothetical protein CEXT_767601 [Caerostris extrusa]|uniref:Uncharacterized protein n=1 Tax=Caerostris extrusa TaxID=172846 RepID=A0AAV4WMC5_CAEEX|nr:hypothetical protein CEXT_767601 [Caerostris extrusa]
MSRHEKSHNRPTLEPKSYMRAAAGVPLGALYFPKKYRGPTGGKGSDLYRINLWHHDNHYDVIVKSVKRFL